MLIFKEFIKNHLGPRFAFYNSNPTIRRILNWQRLEPNQQKLQGIHKAKGLVKKDIIKIIKAYQDKGEIRDDLKPEYIHVLISNMASSLFMDEHAFLTEASEKDKVTIKKDYLNMLYDCIFRWLDPKKSGETM